MMRKKLICLVAAVLIISAACTTHKVDLTADTTHKVEVEPIHITIDINIKVDRALDDFFSDIDNTATQTDSGSTTE